MKKNFIICFMTILAGYILTSCQNDEPNQKIDYPAGPDYTSMDSRGVEAVLAFDAPFMDAAVKSWDFSDEYNNVVSPLSAAYIAALMANGADDEGCKSILNAFGLESSDLTMLNSTMSEIMSSLIHKTKGSQISMGNSVWAHNDENLSIKFTEMFASSAEKYYHAHVGYTDLMANCEPAQHPVNIWAKKIADQNLSFFKPNREVFVLLANVMKFEADWKKNFDKQNTQKGDFYNFDQSISSADFLRGRQNVEYGCYDEGEIISLKYDNPNIYFNIFLPAKDTEFKSDFRTFDLIANDFNSLSGNTELTMPKLDFDVNNQLFEIFCEMGIDKGFVSRDCFPMMIKSSDPNIDFHNMLNITQKLKLTVDENGTKAVVATKAFQNIVSNLSSVPEKIIVNRPFLFEIVAYDQVIVAGRVMKL